MEIGSEYSIKKCESKFSGDVKLSPYFDFLGPSLYLLSGRTAIDCICSDILSNHLVKNVYMPSYCCSSMQAPFLRHGIEIDFYDIEYTGCGLNFLFNPSKKIDILYLNNYFGFSQQIDYAWVKYLKDKGTIIIYDKTHSLFLENDTWIDLADYVFCSLRKWFAITTGAVVSKRSDSWNIPDLRECSFVEDKRHAQYRKHAYLEGNPLVSKDSFYPQFGKFDSCLKEDYVAYRMDAVSCNLLNNIDLGKVIERRKENAQFYYEDLKNMQGARFMFSNLPVYSVPLFIPILFNSSTIRSEVKKCLLSHQLYCPSHWPKDERIHPSMKVNAIYDTELSLICDQRYTSAQLKEISQILKTF